MLLSAISFKNLLFKMKKKVKKEFKEFPEIATRSTSVLMNGSLKKVSSLINATSGLHLA